jgi:drug/metabolite transporter (DMT)-like permease
LKLAWNTALPGCKEGLNRKVHQEIRAKFARKSCRVGPFLRLLCFLAILDWDSYSSVTFRKYLVLAGVTLFAAAGDSMLSHGMKQIGPISLQHPLELILAVLNPWVSVGIVLLLAFFATYTTALSWADLTYVLPATSLGYVLLALAARFVLHEQVSPLRWLGIALISGGVGFVAGGPALTTHGHPDDPHAREAVASAAASGAER